MADATHEPPLLLTDDLVALGPVEQAHTALHARWLNDFATIRALGTWF